MLKSNLSLVLIIVSTSVSSLFALPAFAGTTPDAAMSAIRTVLNPLLANQDKVLNGKTDDNRDCTVDMSGLDNPFYSDVVSVTLKAATTDDEVPMEGTFDMDSKDEVKSVKSEANTFSLTAKTEEMTLVPTQLFGTLVGEKDHKETIKVALNEDHIRSVTIVNDKDVYSCNIR